MKKFTKSLFLFLMIAVFQLSGLASEHSGLPAEESLNKLKIGNQNYVKMHLKHPNQTVKRRAELTKGQHPFVAVLSCSDSRVPPEIIFDQGLGDVFTIRNAGNVLDDHVIGSIEYAVVHCGVKLVVVLGHEDCGAVKATIAKNNESKYIESLTKNIEPAVQASKGSGSELATEVAKNNAIFAVKNLIAADPILCEYIKTHGVKVIPALYNIHTGAVEFLD